MESGCSQDSPECLCPCGCGCQDDSNGQDLPFSKGVCSSCSEGRHEVPPGTSISHLIALHQSIIAQLEGYHVPPGHDKYGKVVS